MRIKFVLSVIILAVLYMGTANAQITPNIQKLSLTENDKKVLNQHISKYTIFTMDKKELASNLGGKGQIRIRIDEDLDWTIDLEFNDMRSPDFKQTYISDEGEFEYNEPFVINTFKGKTSDGRIARFTIDDNTFMGVIIDDKDHYVIRAVNDFTKNGSTNMLVVYKYSDIIPDVEYNDYINDALIAPDEYYIYKNNSKKNADGFQATNSCEYHLRIATDADYEYFQAMGYNLNNTYSNIFSILNIAGGVYESTFNMVFVITNQNVYTTSSTPYTSTDAQNLLNQFRTHWNSNRTSVQRNIVHLFTGKDLDGSIAGIAWLGQIDDTYSTSEHSKSYAYALSMNRTGMYQTTAHEIEHNLNAIDNPPNCLCGTYLASVMCQGTKDPNLWFCQQSINEINIFIYTNVFNRSILRTYIYANTIFPSTPATGFNLKQATETITSTQPINSGHTIYQAGQSIILNPGFKIEAGAGFSAEIKDFTDCDD